MLSNKMRKPLKRLACLSAKLVRLPEVLVYKSHTLGNEVRTKTEEIRCLLAIGFDRINSAPNNLAAKAE
jgi:hypothetical protein